MPATVKPVTVNEIQACPNFAELIAAYARESVIPELGGANPQLSAYKALEQAGALKSLAAYSGTTVVGFISFVVLPAPHQGTLTATTQSFFVKPEFRKTGAGMRLLREAERVAKECGAIGFFASAPINGPLADVLPRIGYRATNTTFFKGLA